MIIRGIQYQRSSLKIKTINHKMKGLPSRKFFCFLLCLNPIRIQVDHKIKISLRAKKRPLNSSLYIFLKYELYFFHLHIAKLHWSFSTEDQYRNFNFLLIFKNFLNSSVESIERSVNYFNVFTYNEWDLNIACKL